MFFEPRHVRDGKHYRHSLKRLINYKRDILPPADLEKLESLLAQVNAALRTRKREEIGKVQKEIDESALKISPPPQDAGIRENVEVILVAIIIAAGVRAFMLQPFKIPTGSMQPTLHGIVGMKMETPPPNPLVRVFDFFWLGRSYFDVVAKEADIVTKVEDKTYLNFFTFTTVTCQRSNYTIFAPKDTLKAYFRVVEGRSYEKGEPIVRGYIDTGDMVFVDKAIYNFIPPKLGEVIVFKTTGIRRIEMPPGIDSQHYIKRLAGMPGDVLRIEAPNLYIDGELASLPVFQKVMSCQNGYRGYSNMLGFPYLSTPSSTFTVPARSYFALGDNSYNSFDSRGWGAVPERNMAGRGAIVFWPFSSRWGFIR